MGNAGATIEAVGYVRVSTEEQHLGPEAQRAELVRWCSSHGARLVAVFSDQGVSGAAQLDRRPGLVGAIDALERGGVFLVAKRDRAARDPLCMAMIERLVERRGARVVSCAGEGSGDSASDLLMRRMVDAFSEYERALIRERTRLALQAKRARGERTGGSIPFGWRLARDGRTLTPEAREQRTIGLVLELRDEGSTSWEAVARELNRRGLVAKGGGDWTGLQVRRAAALATRWGRSPRAVAAA